MTQQNIDIQSAQTRLLLALWDINGLELAVKKSDLTKRVMKSRERAGDYTPCLDALAERGSILLTNKAGMAIADFPKIQIIPENFYLDK